jgi:transcriptional regulator with XRE-family HTH domain
MSPLGRLLRRHREQARLTQEELADRAGVSARTISDIERGVRARAYADTATRLSVALGLTDTDRATFLDAARGPNSLVGAGYRVSRVPRPITSLIDREGEVGPVGHRTRRRGEAAGQHPAGSGSALLCAKLSAASPNIASRMAFFDSK